MANKTGPVILKSNKYGLTLMLDENESFDVILEAVKQKFIESNDFFGEISMILEVYGRELSVDETQALIDAVESNSRISVTLLKENFGLVDTRMKGAIDKFYYEDSYKNAKIISSNVINEDIVETEGSLVILGDVKAKTSVSAKGNIIIFGTLFGKAHAGCEGDKNCYIVTNSLQSDDLSIAGISGEITYNKKWFSKAKDLKKVPSSIVIWNDALYAEPLTNGMINNLIKED